MGEAPDLSVPASMYSNPTEEMLCICADGNGLGIKLVDTEERRYWLTPGVTGWSQGRIIEWVDDLLQSEYRRDYSTSRLYQGPVEVEIYGELE